MGAICRSFGQEESRRKGPAPIIWGAGCTMQTTMRGTLRTNDVRPFVHSSRFVERVVSLLLLPISAPNAKLLSVLGTNTNEAVRRSADPLL